MVAVGDGAGPAVVLAAHLAMTRTGVGSFLFLEKKEEKGRLKVPYLLFAIHTFTFAF